MKKLILLLICLCLLGSSTIAYAEEVSLSNNSSLSVRYTDNEPYQYPVLPNTAVWKTFTHVDQMVKACQIPIEKFREYDYGGLAGNCSTISSFASLQCF